MTALLLLWLGWTLLAFGFGVFVGLSIRDADRREQPADAEVVADFELRRVSGWL